MHYTPLNKMIREAVASGVKEIVLNNVLGQRFIGNGLRGDAKITINGVPGGDLGMFMSGPECEIFGDAEHAPGNTMDSGALFIHGSAGDAVAHSMRGGKVFVKGNIGYRGGIHMKEYEDKRPILAVGGTSHAFLGEYMAGGLILIFGIGQESAVQDRGIGSGIHGGEIVIRGDVNEKLLGVGAKKVAFNEDDLKRLTPVIKEFCERFGIDPSSFLDTNYSRIIPASSRPFAGKYTWE
ncbi:GltB/FmdC/FwdC-like GXGXG domain-containing protein [Methanolobus psychrotolerans]|uniref:GltB/FmdC/FwdC-like GXGXG domain-containing protein n=1 Tax=Methanolobus psychrotolerans TaxID=1874706 RepID=UPI0037444926